MAAKTEVPISAPDTSKLLEPYGCGPVRFAGAGAFLRGIQRRLLAGLNPNVGSVASVFVSRRDAEVKDQAPDGLRNRLGIAMAMRTYTAARDLLTSLQWQKTYNAGARPQQNV